MRYLIVLLLTGCTAVQPIPAQRDIQITWDFSDPCGGRVCVTKEGAAFRIGAPQLKYQDDSGYLEAIGRAGIEAMRGSEAVIEIDHYAYADDPAEPLTERVASIRVDTDPDHLWMRCGPNLAGCTVRDSRRWYVHFEAPVYEEQRSLYELAGHEFLHTADGPAHVGLTGLQDYYSRGNWGSDRYKADVVRDASGHRYRMLQ